LEKPKVGRGIADFFKGTGFDFGLWGAFLKKLMYWIIGLLGSALVFVVLFIKPGILMK
jgi:hypothetical protein